MKTITHKLLLSAVLLTLAGMVMSCKDKEKSIEISFTEYSLVQTPCSWTHLNFDNTVIVNNDKDMVKYVKCENGNYPEVDFSKHTLLLASGRSSSDIRQIDTKFFQNSKNKYTLKVTIYLGFATIAQGWNKAIIVPKISDEAIIILEKRETYD